MNDAKTGSWREYWEALATSADPLAATDLWDIVRSRYGRMCRELAALLDAGPTDLVLNIGCGTGLFERCAAAQVRGWVAMDFAWNMARTAKLNNSGNELVRVVQGSGLALPFADGVFDKALAYSVTHYMTLDELGSMMREMARVTRPGALLLIGDIAEKLPEQSLRSRLSAAYRSAGAKGVLHRLLMRLSAPARLLIRRAKFAYLLATRRLVPVDKPAPISFFSRRDLIELARGLGLEAEAVEQGSGAFYRGRFNLLLRKPRSCKRG